MKEKWYVGSLNKKVFLVFCYPVHTIITRSGSILLGNRKPQVKAGEKAWVTTLQLKPLQSELAPLMYLRIFDSKSNSNFQKIKES